MSFNQATILEQMLSFPLFCRCVARLLCLFPGIALVMTLSACIPIPISTGEEEMFKDKHLAFIELGKTTKQEIEEGIVAVEREEDIKLAREKFRDGDWWLYSQTRDEAKWLIIAQNPDSFGGVDYRYLLIKFDDDGLVAGYELSSSETLRCNRYGVCRGQAGINLLASEDEDQAIKQIDIAADRCGVHVYGRLSYLYHPWSEFSVLIDGQPVGWFVGKKQFLFWQIDPGFHQLVAQSVKHGIKKPIEKQMRFYCGGGGLYFIEVVPRVKGLSTDWWIELEQHDSTKGREDISKRRLLLRRCNSTGTPSDVCD